MRLTTYSSVQFSPSALLAQAGNLYPAYRPQESTPPVIPAHMEYRAPLPPPAHRKDERLSSMSPTHASEQPSGNSTPQARSNPTHPPAQCHLNHQRVPIHKAPITPGPRGDAQ